MLLLAVNDHKRRIEVGYGLEGILPDAKAGRIGMDMVPALKASNYDEAAKVGVQEIADAIAADAKVTLDTNTPLAAIETSADQAAPPPPEPVSSESAAGKWILLLLPFGFFAIFAFFIWRIVRHARRGGSSGIAYSSDSNSFGSSSNSADSSSSSSDSGFSGGDGGDSGGGGASGDW
jgi:uncharacterized protein